jgi:uncharacterized membrane protein (UPF0127 family)
MQRESVLRTRGLPFGLAVVAVSFTVAIGSWVAPRLDVPTQFWLSPIETVSIEGRDLRVVRVRYAQGLRGISTLGGLDGALFALDEVASTQAGMGMFDTLIPLDVVFFDETGRFIDRQTMPVCLSENCPVFRPSRPWQFAIEAPAASLSWVPTDAVLSRR